MKRRTCCIAIISCLALFFSPNAVAEETTTATDDTARIRQIVRDTLSEQSQTDEQKRVKTTFDEGFAFVGADDTLKIGAWMQNDVRIFFTGHPQNSQFLVRRARIDLRGNIEKIFGFRVMGEFEGDNGTNAANLKEGWLEYHQFPSFRVKVGQFKEPFGLENLYGDLHLDFMERPIAENFIRPEQDLGLMFSGKLFRKRLEYGVGVFNGSGTNVAETNEDKDVAGRVAVTPAATSENVWIKGLTIGGSITYGKQTATLDGTGPTTSAGTRFLTFSNPTAGNDVTMNDYRLRAGADVEWLLGPGSFKSEYAFSRLDGVSLGNTIIQWDIYGVSGQATFLLTGEKKTNQGSIAPKKPFNPKEGEWGAWELVARSEILRSDQSLIDNGLAAGSNDLWSASGGMNWYPNRHMKMYVNYAFTGFEDVVANAGGKKEEHAVLFRLQFSL